MASLVCSSALITGCNRGIGLAFVKHILNLPVVPEHVFATCRSLKADNARELAELAEKHSNLHVLEFDVKDVSNRRLFELVKKVEAISSDTGLNLLINNAGISIKERFKTVSFESMMESYVINSVAPLMITKALYPLLRRAAKVKESSSQPQAAVVNISAILASIQDNSTLRSNLPYRTSKAALNMITKSLSIDLAKDGILAVALHPGWVQTDLGGKNAPITTAESVSSMLKLIGSLDESKSGSFLNHDGTTIPW